MASEKNKGRREDQEREEHRMQRNKETQARDMAKDREGEN